MATGSFVSALAGTGNAPDETQAYHGTIFDDYVLDAYQQTSVGEPPNAQLVVTVTCSSGVLAAINADPKYGAVPGAPTGLEIAASGGPGQGITLTMWIPPAGGPFTWNVYRSLTAGGEIYRIATGYPDVGNFDDTSVISGVTYYYTVTAVNASGGEGPMSNEVNYIAP